MPTPNEPQLREMTQAGQNMRTCLKSCQIKKQVSESQLYDVPTIGYPSL